MLQSFVGNVNFNPDFTMISPNVLVKIEFTVTSLPQVGIKVETAAELCKRLNKQKGLQILLDGCC